MSTPTSTSSAAPRAPMLSTADALATLLAAAKPLIGTEMLSTSDALNRVLAADVVSPLDVPPMHTSAMDGYAVRVADLAQGSRHLPVSQRIPAGHAPQPLVAGTAARIFTGATVPPGADAVVMQEQTETTEGAVTILHTPKAGEWITAQGADIRKDTVILPAGTRLTPAALGLAASVGCATLMAARRVKVAVFFTGDELTMPGEPLKPGAIYNSNRFTLTGLLRNLGCEVTDYGIVPDQLDVTRATHRAERERLARLHGDLPQVDEALRFHGGPHVILLADRHAARSEDQIVRASRLAKRCTREVELVRHDAVVGHFAAEVAQQARELRAKSLLRGESPMLPG